MNYAIEDLVVGADAVAARRSTTGTQRGDFFGLPATGRSVRVAQMTFELSPKDASWRITG